MSKMYIEWLKRKETLHIRNTKHGILNAKTATKEIPNAFVFTSIVKNVVTYDNV
jgi:hypothetical protein